VRVPVGTRVREVPRQQLEEESNVYSEAGVDETRRVERQLKSIRRRFRKDQGTGDGGRASSSKCTGT
jgi:hypothetical protein